VETATYCNKLQQTATHCNTLKHTETHRNTMQFLAARYLVETHTLTLQHTAVSCCEIPCGNSTTRLTAIWYLIMYAHTCTLTHTHARTYAHAQSLNKNTHTHTLTFSPSLFISLTHMFMTDDNPVL